MTYGDIYRSYREILSGMDPPRSKKLHGKRNGEVAHVAQTQITDKVAIKLTS